MSDTPTPVVLHVSDGTTRTYALTRDDAAKVLAALQAKEIAWQIGSPGPNL